MVSVVGNDSWFKRAWVLLDSKWRSVFPLNESHFLCSPCGQTTAFSLFLRSLKCPHFLPLEQSDGLTKGEQLPCYCHLPCVPIFSAFSSTLKSCINFKWPVFIERECRQISSEHANLNEHELGQHQHSPSVFCTVLLFWSQVRASVQREECDKLLSSSAFFSMTHFISHFVSLKVFLISNM